MTRRAASLVTPDGCTLSPNGLAEQRARAATLLGAVRALESSPGRLHVEFDDAVDEQLLGELIEAERRCCTFFALDYDRGRRALRITSDDHSALEPFAAFFGGQT